MRKALVKLFGNCLPNTEDIQSLRLLFRNNHKDLVSRIHRIPSNSDIDNLEAGGDAYQAQLNKFARYLLSSFIDRNWSRYIDLFHGSAS